MPEVNKEDVMIIVTALAAFTVFLRPDLENRIVKIIDNLLKEQMKG